MQTYKEFVKEYGDRPKDIVYGMAIVLARQEAGGQLHPLLNQIGGLVSDIRGDWTDPRFECREIAKILEQIRQALEVKRSEGE